MILAIDPGRTGALAALDSANGDLIDVYDLDAMYAGPVLSPPLLLTAIEDLLAGEKADACVVEAVNSFGMGRTSAFNFGQTLGTCRSVPLCLGIPVVDITPAVWKKVMGLGKDKDVARGRASTRWPTWAEMFKRKKDDGRAEAALLAEWWRTTERRAVGQ